MRAARRSALGLFAFALFSIVLSPLHASAITETARLVPSDGAQFDNFGKSVSLSGTTLAIGAPFAEVDTFESVGAVYIFEHDGVGGWTEAIKILAPDWAEFDVFGTDVALSGDDLVVGATGAAVGANSSQGAAYVFGRDVGGPGQWGFVKKLVGPASIGNLSDYGASVAIDGDRVVVGAYNADSPAPGRAFVYARDQGGTDNWGEVANLVDDISDSNAQFGYSVEIDGDLVVVGAFNLDFTPGVANNEGAIYVFDAAAGFAQVGKLFASDHSANDHFAVADIDGHTIVASAAFTENGGTSRGKAYVFENPTLVANGWTEVRAFGASDAMDFAYFGRSVAISDTIVAVGASGHNSNRGQSYRCYENRGGAQQFGEDAILTASDAAPSDFFGIDVAVDGGVVVTGAYLKGTGVVYVYGSPATTDVPILRHDTAMRAWPNPASSRVSFQLGGAGGAPVEIAVFDIHGRRMGGVRSDATGAAVWDVPPQADNGLYFARARTGSGTEVRRLVVQR